MKENSKRRQFYDKNTLIIDIKPFFDDYDKNDSRPFIELTLEEWQTNLSCIDYYKCAYWKNNKIVIDFDQTKIKEYNISILRDKIKTLTLYLSTTDYIVTKVNEAQITGSSEEVEELKTKYAKELAKRKTVRAEINSLIEELSTTDFAISTK